MSPKIDFMRAGLLAAGLLLTEAQIHAQAAGLTILHAFGKGNDGQNPFGALTIDSAGNLYGTTDYGGQGYGTVFQLVAPKDRREKRLLSFLDGSYPNGPVYRDSAGDLFGMTTQGGAHDYGTIYEIAADGNTALLHEFASGTDGSLPEAGLIADVSGNLFGTTSKGGNLGCGGGEGCGTVFEITPDGDESVLYAFKAGDDGALPYSNLIADTAGNFYGTTLEGGAGNCGGGGCGTVFKLSKRGKESVLHAFTGGADGGAPSASLIADAAGNFYGTAYQGGTTGCGGNGCGTVFKLAPDGTLTVLHAFQGGNDGANPSSTLVSDANGDLYGTTTFGGSTSCNGAGCGTIFEITAKGAEKVLYAFGTDDSAAYPYAGLVTDGSGTFYGTTGDGGAYGDGTVFRFRK